MAGEKTLIPPAAAPARTAPMPIGSHNGWLLFRGIVAVLFGVVALAMPVVTLGSLVLVFSAYLLADGVLAIVAAVRAARAGEAWGGSAFEGLADLVAGAIALLWPGITLIVLVVLTGLWAIVSGAFMVYASWRAKLPRGRWLWAFAGVLSVVWGVLLLVAPVPGAVVMTIWLGAYALVFGASLLIASWRLRQGRGAR